MGNNTVSIKVSRNYFDKIFEPQRRSIQNKLGISNFSQVKFTEYLARSPKLDMGLFNKKRGNFRTII
jgi:hypothetical protein